MIDGEGYELVLTPPAIRAIQTATPEAVAAAVIEFMTGPLMDNPRRVGKMLRHELQGVWSARRGTYRVLYRISDHTNEVSVLRIDHRCDFYHRRPEQPPTERATRPIREVLLVAGVHPGRGLPSRRWR